MQESRIKKQLDIKHKRSTQTRTSKNNKKDKNSLKHVTNNVKNGRTIIATTLTSSPEQ